MKSSSGSAVRGAFGFHRAAAVQAILSDAARLCRAHGRGPLRPRVARAVRRVPREAFVSEDLLPDAYADRALPIDQGQTISQPSLVAFMSNLAAVEATDRALEVGTGSGYQTAILAELAQHVYSVEYIASLAAAAQKRVRHLGYLNVDVRTGDGRQGWVERAPFDAIIVTAAAREVPGPLIAQLAPGGRLVVPVKGRSGQKLVLLTKTVEGAVRWRAVLPVVFVPLV